MARFEPRTIRVPVCCATNWAVRTGYDTVCYLDVCSIQVSGIQNSTALETNWIGSLLFNINVVFCFSVKLKWTHQTAVLITSNCLVQVTYKGIMTNHFFSWWFLLLKVWNFLEADSKNKLFSWNEYLLRPLSMINQILKKEMK